MRPVLVADDGSDTAAHAVKWARTFAAERALNLVVVRVNPNDDDSQDEDLGRITIRDRHPGSAIMELAAELDAHLIVLGRRGAGGFPSLPIGATAHQVAGSCGRPVAVIPETSRRGAPALVQRVTIGLDPLVGSADTLRWAAQNFQDAHFTTVHALDLAPVFLHPDVDSADTDIYERAYKRGMALMHDQWCDPLLEAGIAYEAVVQDGGAVEVLLTTAISTAADLVVVGQRDRGPFSGMLGGVSQRVLAYASSAALIVPLHR